MVDKKEKITKWLLFSVLVIGFALQLYLVYYGYRAYDYLVPPGSDAIQHYKIIQGILESGRVNLLSYPPGFHILVIGLSKIFQTDPFNILAYWTPVLIVLPSVSMFFLLKQIFDNKVTVITTLIFLLASAYPLYGFVDGNYPNILAYGVLGILLFAFVIRFIKSKAYINLIIASLLLLAIALIHHFAFINIVVILLFFAVTRAISLIKNKTGKTKVGLWQFVTGLVAFVIAILTLYLAAKLYGDTIIKFANGFISNNPALQNGYLNSALDFSEYALFSGNVIWYLGLGGLFYLLISSFKDGTQSSAKQLAIIWILYFFIMSRFASTSLPARFAREMAPALVLAIGFLLNYLLNFNPLRHTSYKKFFGYGLIGFMIVTNSLLFTGIAKIPESFNQMIWFWPDDQIKINHIQAILEKTKGSNHKVLYNPYANLYIPIKANNGFVPLQLTPEELAIAEKNLETAYDFNSISKKPSKLTEYQKMIYDIRDRSDDYQFVFIDVKPPSNPSGEVYPRYSGYDVYKNVMYDLTDSGEAIKKFEDGARLYKMY